ncbi:hypothetical protein Q8A73_014564 [Channa argus]|nr:hypothetical protein Q8A73_014564 [Channa argus]
MKTSGTSADSPMGQYEGWRSSFLFSSCVSLEFAGATSSPSQRSFENLGRPDVVKRRSYQEVTSGRPVSLC